ncbi:DUF1993 domain-containing protein [Legionella bononiensis]|uniref:DUF1993 domain-containing protein n=1 Tax=Legionella bononiensis TaxID=2793102 RepID=A0ABS1WCK0_9GAMM|nr:DUF1993 domain-containing protein [Legionella bononiensis]MBL7478948.1 DUF1993 domain-containing protein [Legionella bononiensis]MBL7527080.1 DUF1993 domain-containing protein [Legionella bononiensis]MBL7562049.1 DUF1993 domain-containing protein [Legionella bononiensis]
MSLSMHQITIPVFIRMLNNISIILKKAEAHCVKAQIDPAEWLNARLAPDMFPLVRQVQIATDTAKGCASRLAAIEIPVYEDTESSFAELDDRIQKTIHFLQSFSSSQIDSSENREVTLKAQHHELHFKGLDYVTHFVLPNFYFHISMTYAILRHNGLVIGKTDYLGSIQ